ncbi:MAG: hypothetical protein E4H02_03915 [Lentisphaerales bacterium]|jgi:hypothetical protein|nr:MAG: hypothetical protein E4H02_03915 [Lentisphaerales bacterium]
MTLKRRKIGYCSIVRDDRAQALTEFAIVIPVMFLMFLLMIQYFIIAQCSQVGNYAAYCAARVYAVRECWDPDAQDTAEKAAALAYAPVSKLVPGEVPFFAIGSLSDLLPGGMPDIFDNMVDLTEGFFVAHYFRLNKTDGGGSIDITKSGSPEQINVVINYAYPIYIPGLATLWQITGGQQDIKDDLEPMQAGLTLAKLSHVSLYPYVNVQSKCAMGNESWSGSPRERATTDSAAATDESLEQRQQEMTEAKDELDAAIAEEAKQHDQWETAKAQREAAQAEYDAVMGDPSSTAGERAAALGKLNAAKAKEQSEWLDYLGAKSDREDAQDHFEDVTGEDYG